MEPFWPLTPLSVNLMIKFYLPSICVYVETHDSVCLLTILQLSINEWWWVVLITWDIRLKFVLFNLRWVEISICDSIKLWYDMRTCVYAKMFSASIFRVGRLECGWLRLCPLWSMCTIHSSIGTGLPDSCGFSLTLLFTDDLWILFSIFISWSLCKCSLKYVAVEIERRFFFIFDCVMY